MANSLMEQNKVGDMEYCRTGVNEANGRVKFCDKNFQDDFVSNVDCKDPEEFCNICCENEFGGLQLPKRSSCYDMCEVTPHKKEEEENSEGNKKTGGHFFWAEKQNGMS